MNLEEVEIKNANLYEFSDSIREMGFLEVARRYWRVSNKMRQMVAFELQPPQMVIWAAIQSQMLAGLPVRIRVLKSRQQGASLLLQLLLDWWTLSHPSHLSLSIANKKELPKQWVRHLRRLHRQLSKQRKDCPDLSVSNENELMYDDLEGSRYMIGSSLGVTPGMGETINVVHCSEIASWSDPDAILSDLLPAMPPTKDTMVIQESTGRSVGDWWYQRYYECEDPDCEYIKVFLPWYLSPEYDQDTVEDRDDNDKKKLAKYTWNDLEPLDARETETLMYAERYQKNIAHLYKVPDLTPGQMMWRRKKIITDFHGNIDLFANQYPSCEMEAFLSEGMNVFTSDQVRAARKTVREPDAAYNITFEKWHPKSLRLLENETSGEMIVWNHKNPEGDYVESDSRYHYVIGADCQWGEGGNADFDVLYVQCLETRTIVAKVKGRYDLSTWGKIIAGIGWKYNTALVAPERNARASSGVMELLLGKSSDWRYPNIFVRSSDRLNIRGHNMKDYGWHTSHDSKNEIIVYAMSATVDGEYDWADTECVSQMQAYMRDKNRKLTAPRGSHDDDLMARMITGYVAHIESPNMDLYIKPPKTQNVYGYTSLENKLDAMAKGTYHLAYDDEDPMTDSDEFMDSENEEFRKQTRMYSVNCN